MYVKIMPQDFDYPTAFYEASGETEVDVTIKSFYEFGAQEEWITKYADKYIEHRVTSTDSLPKRQFYDRVENVAQVDVARIDIINHEEDRYQHIFTGLCDIYLLNDNGDTVDSYDLLIWKDDDVLSGFKSHSVKDLNETPEGELVQDTKE